MYIYMCVYKMYMELGQRSPYTFAILHTSHQENLPSWTQAYWWQGLIIIGMHYKRYER